MPSNSPFIMHLTQQPPFIPDSAEVMVVTIELSPGTPGTPPHRHSGPVFGYMLEGEMIFEQVRRHHDRSPGRADADPGLRR
jgi:quercetin dioxygenase-like cupin family protein